MTKKITLTFCFALIFSITLHAADKNAAKPTKKTPAKSTVSKNKPVEAKKPKPAPKPEEPSGPIVRKIEFSGVKRTPPEMLKAISNKYFGNGLYGEWTQKMLQEIRNIPIVSGVNLMRDMTGNITIQITEREPIAYLYLDQYYWMDERAKVIQPIEKTQLEDKVFFSGPWKNPSDYQKKNGSSVMMEGIHFYTDLLSKDFEEKKISEIHFDANLGWIMYRIGSRAPVVFGTQNLPQKIERFSQVVSQLSPLEASVSKIDADFNDRVVVKLTSVSK